jgi:adenylate kinase
MRLIIIGPPGSGKGTQAKRLSERLGLAHFSTGDILRDAIHKQTPEGKSASSYVATGRLVPDEIVNEIIRALFRGKAPPKQFIVDGYPRTIAQASFFDQVLGEQGLDVGGVIFLLVPDEEIYLRLGGRRTCPNPACGASYHVAFKPPRQADMCDLCGTRLVQREDDKLETIARRLGVYHAVYDELVDHYRRRGLLVEVPGVGDIEEIYERIVKALKPEA